MSGQATRRWPALLALLLVAPTLAGCVGTGPRPGSLREESGRAGFSTTSVFPGGHSTVGAFSRVLVQGPFAVGPVEVVSFPSQRDGAGVQVALVRPVVPAGTRVPVIADGTPYFAPLTPESVVANLRYQRLVPNFVPSGYAVAFIPVRGTSSAGGCMDLMGPLERADLDQAVTWLGTQPWSNGNVGMVGLSYDGSTPWEVAALGNPHLKTIVPMAGVSDLHDLMFHNGSVQWFGPAVFEANYYQFGFAENNPANGRGLDESIDGVACPESWEGVGASLRSSLLLERDSGGFWAERDSRPGTLERYNGSVFLVHGLDDWRVPPSQDYPWARALEQKGVVVKHLLGQWPHAYPDEPAESSHVRWDWAEILLHWFDRWLKEDASVDLGPRVQVEDSQGKWRDEEAWPPADAVTTTLWLTPGGALSSGTPSSEESVVVGPDNDPGNVWHNSDIVLDEEPAWPLAPVPCPGCARFATGPLDADFRFAGRPRLHVAVTPTGPGGHLAAWLFAEGNGGAQRLGRAQLDLRLADGGSEPKGVTPGERLVAHMQFEPLDAVVPRGSRLVVVVTQGATDERLPSVPPYPVTLHAGAGSALKLETFARASAAFFEPPG